MSIWEFDRKYWQQNRRIVGVDEVGRGCLSGPVIAAAFSADPHEELPEVTDSKKLPERKRKELYNQLIRSSSYISVGLITAREIDSINILQASLKAMRIAISGIRCKIDLVLVDGNAKPKSNFDEECLIGGDSISGSIAAASIIAKVTRDILMEHYHHEWPDYGYDKNKGYGTKAHIKALKEHGPTPIHRMTYGSVRQMMLEY